MIIAAVAVVIVIAVAAIIVINPFKGGSDDGDRTYDITSNLLVFGNANNDDYLDYKDVTLIQNMIDGKFTYNIKDYPLADANTDGDIDSKDVELVNKFLAGQSATMYYINWNWEKASVQFPLSGNISGVNSQCIDVAIILGMYDQFVGMREAQDKIAGLSDNWYPGAAKRIKTVGNNGEVVDLEKALALKTKIFLGEKTYLPDSFVKSVAKADPSAAVIQLPINRVMTSEEHGNIYVSNTIITLGVLTNNQGATAKYVKWFAESEDAVGKLVKQAAKQPAKDFVVVYNPAAKDDIWVDMYCPDLDIQYGDAMNVLKLGLKPAFTETGMGDGSYKYDMEKILKLDPDVIFISTWGMIDHMDPETYNDQVSKMAEFFTASTAYKNDKVISFSFELMGTIPATSMLMAIGGIIWPDIFDIEDGYDMINEYINTFTLLGLNGGKAAFDVRETVGFAPDAWGA